MPAAAQRIWTSAQQLRGAGVPSAFQKELCSILNAVIRADRHSGAALRPAAVLCRGFNELCITRRKTDAGALPFPPGGRCYRGGALPDEHRAFYKPGVKLGC